MPLEDLGAGRRSARASRSCGRRPPAGAGSRRSAAPGTCVPASAKPARGRAPVGAVGAVLARRSQRGDRGVVARGQRRRPWRASSRRRASVERCRRACCSSSSTRAVVGRIGHDARRSGGSSPPSAPSPARRCRSARSASARVDARARDGRLERVEVDDDEVDAARSRARSIAARCAGSSRSGQDARRGSAGAASSRARPSSRGSRCSSETSRTGMPAVAEALVGAAGREQLDPARRRARARSPRRRVLSETLRSARSILCCMACFLPTRARANSGGCALAAV